ncbi:MAG: CPBP family intramembrane metalloprotease [Deltaproteobacteria bacterium]|nr:CPBP family intramembrane metalloprotease [Deltaproteobacteria bacterium]
MKQGGTLIAAVLLMEAAAWVSRPVVPMDPFLLLGIARSAEAMLLFFLGPWSFQGPQNRPALVKSVVLAFAASAIGMAALLAWFHLLRLPVFGLPRRATPPAPGWALFLFTTSIASPVAEELVFRGLIYRFLRLRLSALSAAGAVSGGFAALHLPFGGQFLAPFFGSLVFCAGYEKEKTVLAPILLHVFGNLIIFLSPFWLFR